MLRQQVIVAWRLCGSNLSLWERMELRHLYKGSKERNGNCTRADARKRRMKKKQ